MRELVRQAMREGAVGLSTSLQYPPAPYAETAELIALASEAAKLGGVYATHMRSESDEILPAIDEAIRIGREASIPVEIWHLKTAGKRNWGRMPEVVAKIESARKAGVDIAADTYAYPAWFNSLSSFVPPWAHDGGTAKLLERLRDPDARARIRKEIESEDAGWDNSWQEIPGPEAILIGAVHNPALRRFQGKTLAEVAQARGGEPIDALLDFLIEDQAYTFVAVFGMSEPDVALALEQPWVSINCDSEGSAPEGILSQEPPAPAGVRHLPPDPPQVRAGGEAADAGGRDPQIHARSRRSACGWAIAECSRSACGRTSWSSIRRRFATARRSPAAPAGRRDALGAGERRAGDRGRQGDGAPESVARAGWRGDPGDEVPGVRGIARRHGD